jgi:hypothetical protein
MAFQGLSHKRKALPMNTIFSNGSLFLGPSSPRNILTLFANVCDDTVFPLVITEDFRWQVPPPFLHGFRFPFNVGIPKSFGEFQGHIGSPNTTALGVVSFSSPLTPYSPLFGWRAKRYGKVGLTYYYFLKNLFISSCHGANLFFISITNHSEYFFT